MKEVLLMDSIILNSFPLNVRLSTDTSGEHSGCLCDNGQMLAGRFACFKGLKASVL